MSNRRRLNSKVTDLLIVFLMVLLVVGLFFLGIKITSLKKSNKSESVSKTELQSDNSKEELSDNSNVENLVNENENVENTTNSVSQKQTKSKSKGKNPVWVDTAVQDIKDIYGSDDKQVFLTFDDGPSQNITPQILEILKEENIPASFFVLGKCTKEYPELVKQEYEAGHFIANHGYSHTYSQIYSSVDSVFDEYNRTNDEIRTAIGNDEYDPHLFRFPGGSSGGPYDSLKAQAKSQLADNKVASTNWNCLSSDAAGKTTVDGQYQEVLDTAGSKTSLIILMHDAADKKSTPETLKKVIKHYKDLGYEFKNFYDIFNEENQAKAEAAKAEAAKAEAENAANTDSTNTTEHDNNTSTNSSSSKVTVTNTSTKR